MPVRELLRDKRVAAALAAVAVLSVGYRLATSGKGAAVPPAPQAVEAPPPSVPGPAGPVLPPMAAAPKSPPPSIPAGWSGPAWSWDRNPFLSSSADRPPGKSGTGTPADAALPELRGTVVSDGAGLAIFGDRLVPAGRAIGEWTLTGVEPYRVSIRRGKETRVLEIYRQ